MNIQEYQEIELRIRSHNPKLEGSVKYWQGRSEFLDDPIEETFWQQLNLWFPAKKGR